MKIILDKQEFRVKEFWTSKMLLNIFLKTILLGIHLRKQRASKNVVKNGTIEKSSGSFKKKLIDNYLYLLV